MNIVLAEQREAFTTFSTPYATALAARQTDLGSIAEEVLFWVCTGGETTYVRTEHEDPRFAGFRSRNHHR